MSEDGKCMMLDKNIDIRRLRSCWLEGDWIGGEMDV